MKKILTLAAWCMSIIVVNAQSLVKDINTYNGEQNLVLADEKPVTINNVVYYVANDDINGIELWRTDGTPAGTRMVRDIYPGPDDGNPRWLTEVNGMLYFSANDGVHGIELWKSDGTAEGTVMVKNIVPSSMGSVPQYLVNNNGVLFFSAGGPINVTYLPDRELWKSDGTEAGTVQVVNINPSFDSDPTNLVSMNGEVYFAATDAGIKRLWKSNGFAAGSMRLSSTLTVGGPMTASGNYVYFSALTPSDGNELCKTDGTVVGTGMVKNIHPTGSSLPSLMTDVNGTLFFVATDGGTNNRELWKSDGTEAGTVIVKDLYTGTAVNAPPADLVNVNGTLYFTAYDGVTGRELWKSDGTEAGTVLVKDINAGGATTTHSGLVNVFSTLYFNGRDAGGNELYKSDGTAAGTVRVADISPGSISSQPQFISPLMLAGNVPGLVFFASNNPMGRELWVSNGLAAGTSLVVNINPENDDSDVGRYAFSNGSIYFAADTRNEGVELWKSDGTAAGTFMLKNIGAGGVDGNPQYMVNYGGYIYFTSVSDLWRTDGTTAGTVLVKAGIAPRYMMVHNGFIYFSGAEGTSGSELWKSDGTEAGTAMLKEIRPGGTSSTRSSDPQNFTTVGNLLMFSAIDGTGTRQIWKTDGTEAGTVKVNPAVPITAVGTEFAAAGGLLFFTAESSGTGVELWRSDGTDAGTFMVKNIAADQPLVTGSTPKYLTRLGNIILFSALDGTGDGSLGRELWRSDGTNAGTFMVRNINTSPTAVSPPVEGGSHPLQITVADGIAYFFAYTPEYGKELWKTDGTTAGTVLVADAVPGIQSGVPDDYITATADYKPAAVGGSVYYASGSAVTGMELHRANNAGAGITNEIIAGPRGTSPIRFFGADNVLYFSNDDAIHGRELWSYDPSVNYILPPGSAQVTVNINEENMADTLGQLIARVRQAGAQPLNHEVLVKVVVDGSVQSYNGQAYVQRHYDIEPRLNAATATGRVTLYFTQQEFNNYNGAPGTADLPVNATDAAGKSNLRVTQYHGVGTLPGNYPGPVEVIDPADGDIVWNNDRSRWEVTFDVTGFSGFYTTSVASASLPVHLLSFTGRSENRMVRLEWKVAEEQGIAHYDIEKSSNGIDFAFLDKVTARNIANSTYQALDTRPLAGMNYYRLKIVDEDGKYSYSRTVRIDMNSRAEVTVYPVPAVSRVTVRLNDAALLNSAASLFDNSGKLVRSFRLTSMEHVIDLGPLASGTYYLQTKDGGTLMIQKK